MSEQVPAEPVTESEAAEAALRAKGFSKEFLDDMRKTPFLDPAEVVVAGDLTPGCSASVAARAAEYAGTFLDDGRANLPWGDDHEGLVVGLLTGSSPVNIKEDELDADGQPVQARNKDGTPRVGPTGKPVRAKVSYDVMVSDGQPELIYCQGWFYHDEDGREIAKWHPVMQDGRQRRRSALELTRRLNWIASVVAGMGEAGRGKPGRRNMLIKLGALARGSEKVPGKAWAESLVLVAGALPQDLAGYESPEVGTSLLWLTDEFAKFVVGTDDLGEHLKRGWLQAVKDEAGNVTGVRAVPAWLKVQVVGCNIDPLDPKSLLDGIAAKEAQVKTPPSLMARNILRVLGARMDPSDPSSEALYDRGAVRAKFGYSEDTLRRYERLDQCCDEVKRCIDSGQMSMTFALVGRDAAFVVPAPKQGKRGEGAAEVLPPDKQRLVLEHLCEVIGEDESGEGCRFTGAAAMRHGARLRDLAVAGKLLPYGQAAPDEDEGTTRRPSDSAPAPAASGTDGVGAGSTATEPVKKHRQPRSLIDVAAFREHMARAVAAAPPEAHYATPEDVTSAALNADRDRLALASALAMVFTGYEPPSVLDAWPAVRDVVVAAMPAASPEVPAGPPEVDLITDWCCLAVEEMSLKGLDAPPPVTAATDSHGRRPTAEQAARCNAMIGAWLKEFHAAGQTATLLDEFLLVKVASIDATTLASA